MTFANATTEPDADGEDIAVETATQYSDFFSDQTIRLGIAPITEKRATTIAQQLSLFLEEHDASAHVRSVASVHDAIDDDTETAVRVNSDLPDELPCCLSIELEFESVSDDTATEIAEDYRDLLTGELPDGTIESLGRVLADATADQPRSVVRLRKNDGSKRDAFEWHTDTTVDQEAF